MQEERMYSFEEVREILELANAARTICHELPMNFGLLYVNPAKELSEKLGNYPRLFEDVIQYISERVGCYEEECKDLNEEEMALRIKELNGDYNVFIENIPRTISGLGILLAMDKSTL